MKLLAVLLLMIGTANAQITPDYAKETRWAEQVEDGLMDGDSVGLLLVIMNLWLFTHPVKLTLQELLWLSMV